jgi:ribosomal-protein-alanine N-acetyltransferase
MERFKEAIRIIVKNMKPRFPDDIQYANIDEVDDIFKIEQKCFPGNTSYSKRLLKYLMLDSNNTCLVEKQENVIRGFIIVTCNQESLICSIETIDVDPDFKNKGIGLKLLRAAEIEMVQRGMRCSQLEVSEGNQAALAVYEKAGYKFKEKLEGYYKFEHNGTCNAIRMIKSL